MGLWGYGSSMTATGDLPSDEGLIQVLDREGNVHEEATVPDLDDETLVTIYEQMRFARHLDERAISLHRQGRIGTYPPLAGQEAAQVASTHALADEDWISYQYREHGAVISRGISEEFLLYWMGHEEGSGWLSDQYIFPMNISIGSQIPHATGLAWAAKLKGDDGAVVCHFGDGATSEGDFHEGMNFAGVFDVPAIFLCNNNQYAISIGRDAQTASRTIAQKGPAYGIPSRRVDGMDPLAVYAVTQEAVQRAKADDPDPPNPEIGRAARPTFIEAVMYRLGAHTTVDDPDVYRDEAEVERWRAYDPIDRYERFLRDRGLVDDEQIAAMETEIEDEVAELIDRAEEVEADPESMFERPDENTPSRVKRQQEELRQLRERHGDDALLRDE